MSIRNLLSVTLFVALALTSCQSSARELAGVAERGADVSGDHPSPADTAPTPYTSDEISRSHPAGSFTEYRISGPGRPALTQRTEWATVSDEGCTIVTSMRHSDGSKIGSPKTDHVTWWMLRDHAALPTDEVTIENDRIATEAGDFDCKVYTHVVEADGVVQTMKLWFDDKSAGSPVLLTTEANGKHVMRMELLATNRGSIAGR